MIKIAAKPPKYNILDAFSYKIILIELLLKFDILLRKQMEMQMHDLSQILKSQLSKKRGN